MILEGVVRAWAPSIDWHWLPPWMDTLLVVLFMILTVPHRSREQGSKAHFAVVLSPELHVPTKDIGGRLHFVAGSAASRRHRPSMVLTF